MTVVVYDRTAKKAHSLNHRLHGFGVNAMERLTSISFPPDFERQFNTADGADFVLAGLEQLKTAGLLEIEGDSLSPEIGPMMSRRSALAAGSALFPLIATVLVPSAAAAKSGDKVD
jgi:hypothetical protein